ncbi:siderophore-iron reductase FhuF [Klebsiella oxytoca]|uniref:siderophore-iron reductase FhuF n=1 Tax=Klebsiella oxytoca TaxID=571 RepID=UPI00024FCA06|nr:siderophore-iron reductase FhuF [Klebsiella oxytoca]EHT04339.1 siderophore-iron reductase FhuF [Klebsiella oxytoca 10-5245]EJA2383140.1 siderophore-iron reductase FhuF [Klebsiella oxytoca]EJZ8301472.1 siderophore-iron reductase FhuF [Klebsiella oxytoca]EKM0802936.1 siderophore-iron reductase FhuF [Klebsiella oxytoca]EKT7902273.1 siderophore-iron reductase FhuF [Klebsiella oxytoca]
MAYRSLAFNYDLIWRAPLPSAERELANALHDKIAALRPHLLDFLRLNEEAPHHALTLTEWSQPAMLSSLLATWSDHIYRNQPGKPREQKPLLSLWAQWYIGLLVPPLMLALLSEERALSLAPEHFRVEFHETGRAARFWIEVHSAGASPEQSAQSRMEKLIATALQPVVQALEATGDINGKLIWSNTGYLINWYLGEMKTLLGDEKIAALRQHCFFEKQFSDGQDNPLWRTVVLREGQLVRRTCCQRYRLPDVQQCGDCTLK